MILVALSSAIAILWNIGFGIVAFYFALHGLWLQAIFFALVVDWIKFNVTTKVVSR